MTEKAGIIFTKAQEKGKREMSKLNFGLKECSKCEYNLRCQECIYNKKDISKLIAEVKADTVRKMKERLKSCFEDDVKYDGFRIAIWIDQIAKEMEESVDEG